MNWNLLQTFAAVARSGNFVLASKQLELNATTVARQIRTLESQLDQRLFEQSRDAQLLTEDGQILLAAVEKMERASANYLTGDTRGAEGPSGIVRLSVSEGFGNSFLAPRMADFQSAFPDVRVEIVATNGFLNPSRKETDIAILLAQPDHGPLVTRKLTDYRLGLYASFELAERLPPAPSLADLRAERAIGYVPDLIYAPELDYQEEFGLIATPGLRSTSILAQARMIGSGAGLGILPCFLADEDARLLRLLPERHIARSFWLAVHQNVTRQPRIRAFVDWLVSECESARAQFLA